jgi:hypothetical protein
MVEEVAEEEEDEVGEEARFRITEKITSIDLTIVDGGNEAEEEETNVKVTRSALEQQQSSSKKENSAYSRFLQFGELHFPTFESSFSLSRFFSFHSF